MVRHRVSRCIRLLRALGVWLAQYPEWRVAPGEPSSGHEHRRAGMAHRRPTRAGSELAGSTAVGGHVLAAAQIAPAGPISPRARLTTLDPVLQRGASAASYSCATPSK